LDATTWVYLDASKKKVYLRYWRFLKTTHKYHNKLFYRFYDNTPEIEPPLKRHHNGEHVYKMVKNIHVVYGKKNPDRTIRDRSTPPIAGVPFMKQSIFFQYLPYWSDLEVPMLLMLCTCRRMSLRVSLVPWCTRGRQSMVWNHGKTWCS
jgi:hypothetical protein